MTAPSKLSFRHGLDGLYVKFCELRDGAPVDGAALQGPLQPVAMVAGLGQAWGRAKLVRAAIVLALMPVLAFLANAVGAPLWGSVCLLIVVGPLVWFGLSALLALRTMRAHTVKLAAQLEQSRLESATPREVTLELTLDGLVFTADVSTSASGRSPEPGAPNPAGEQPSARVRLTHPWKELVLVQASAEALEIGLSLELPNGEGAFRHRWTIPSSAFSGPSAMREFAAFLEEKRAARGGENLARTDVGADRDA